MLTLSLLYNSNKEHTFYQVYVNGIYFSFMAYNTNFYRLSFIYLGHNLVNYNFPNYGFTPHILDNLILLEYLLKYPQIIINLLLN